MLTFKLLFHSFVVQWCLNSTSMFLKQFVNNFWGLVFVLSFFLMLLCCCWVFLKLLLMDVGCAFYSFHFVVVLGSFMVVFWGVFFCFLAEVSFWKG